MSSDLPVFIWLGASEEEKAEKMPLVQKAITDREKELGRPLNSTEILQTWGQVIEPDPTKVTHIGARPPRGFPPLQR